MRGLGTLRGGISAQPSQEPPDFSHCAQGSLACSLLQGSGKVEGGTASRQSLFSECVLRQQLGSERSMCVPSLHFPDLPQCYALMLPPVFAPRGSGRGLVTSAEMVCYSGWLQSGLAWCGVTLDSGIVHSTHPVKAPFYPRQLNSDTEEECIAESTMRDCQCEVGWFLSDQSLLDPLYPRESHQVNFSLVKKHNPSLSNSFQMPHRASFSSWGEEINCGKQGGYSPGQLQLKSLLSPALPTVWLAYVCEARLGGSVQASPEGAGRWEAVAVVVGGWGGGVTTGIQVIQRILFINVGPNPHYSLWTMDHGPPTPFSPHSLDGRGKGHLSLGVKGRGGHRPLMSVFPDEIKICSVRGRSQGGWDSQRGGERDGCKHADSAAPRFMNKPIHTQTLIICQSIIRAGSCHSPADHSITLEEEARQDSFYRQTEWRHSVLTPQVAWTQGPVKNDTRGGQDSRASSTDEPLFKAREEPMPGWLAGWGLARALPCPRQRNMRRGANSKRRAERDNRPLCLPRQIMASSGTIISDSCDGQAVGAGHWRRMGEGIDSSRLTFDPWTLFTYLLL
ncbi:hypothetical protein JZ751_000475 [Albula glossodonta]|uniref:Uncharacterized protein n=1 Tax=Albula glossodonta TaxID=121402 RepID=A0A8T2PW11_9TELE|nr:hypothetical protein JZ751_000475 [Albula glossodonta]